MVGGIQFLYTCTSRHIQMLSASQLAFGAFCLGRLKLCGHTFIDLTYKRTGLKVRNGFHLEMATTGCLHGKTIKAATARINTAVNTDGALSSSAMAVIALEWIRGVRRRADGRGSAALWRRKGLERNACKA